MPLRFSFSCLKETFCVVSDVLMVHFWVNFPKTKDNFLVCFNVHWNFFSTPQVEEMFPEKVQFEYKEKVGEFPTKLIDFKPQKSLLGNRKLLGDTDNFPTCNTRFRTESTNRMLKLVQYEYFLENCYANLHETYIQLY